MKHGPVLELLEPETVSGVIGNHVIWLLLIYLKNKSFFSPQIVKLLNLKWENFLSPRYELGNSQHYFQLIKQSHPALKDLL